jgi:hypothetical protein
MSAAIRIGDDIVARGYQWPAARDGGVVFVGIDPGQRGAVAAVRTVQQEPRSAARVVSAVVCHAGGAGGYQGSARTLDPRRAALAIEHVVAAAGPAGHVLVAIEALGRRPGEGVVSTSTAGLSWGVWQAVLALRGWTYRTVQTQAVDRALGLQPVGRVARKALITYQTALVLSAATSSTEAQWREVLTPGRGRTVSDGGADALWIALGLARGL